MDTENVGIDKNGMVICHRCKGGGKFYEDENQNILPLPDHIKFNKVDILICAACMGKGKITWTKQILGNHL